MITLTTSMWNRATISLVLLLMAKRSCNSPSCFFTYSLACWTNFIFLRIDHGCWRTLPKTSLCKRIFSNICSWDIPASSILIAVLLTFTFFFSEYFILNLWISNVVTYSPELVVKADDLLRSDIKLASSGIIDDIGEDDLLCFWCLPFLMLNRLWSIAFTLAE